MKKKINAKFVWISALAILLTGVGAMILFYNILNEPEFNNNFKNITIVILSKDKNNKLTDSFNDMMNRMDNLNNDEEYN